MRFPAGVENVCTYYLPAGAVKSAKVQLSRDHTDWNEQQIKDAIRARWNADHASCRLGAYHHIPAQAPLRFIQLSGYVRTWRPSSLVRREVGQDCNNRRVIFFRSRGGTPKHPPRLVGRVLEILDEQARQASCSAAYPRGSDKIFSADMPVDLRLAMLSSNADAARKEIESCFPIHNPMTRFGVVWTTRGYYLSRKVTKHVDTNVVLRANEQPEYIPPDIE